MQLSFFKTCNVCNQSKLYLEFNKCNANKDGYKSLCRMCQSLDYQNNKESHKANVQRWAEQHREQSREIKRRWKQNHPDADRNYVLEHSEQVKAKHREYSAKNSKAIVARKKRWYQAFPEKLAALSNRRRAYKAQAEGSFTADEWKSLCDRYDNRCVCCKEQKPLTVDHVLPLSKGGSNDISNIQPLCKTCNSKKHAHHIDYR